MNKTNQIVGGHSPKSPYWIIEIECLINPRDISSNILQIIEILNQHKCPWPTDEEWKNFLPKWFVESFFNLSKENAITLMKNIPKEKWNELPWDFGSWLDAIREKGWEWHDIILEKGELKISLELFEWPANLEALEKIIVASGGKIIKWGWIN